jgi:hypothetical protein
MNGCIILYCIFYFASKAVDSEFSETNHTEILNWPPQKRISFIHQWLYSPLLGSGLFFSFVIFTLTAGLLERVISASQGRYLHTRQHKHRINAHTNIHALSGIRTQDPNVRASEESSSLRPRGHFDRRTNELANWIPYVSTHFYNRLVHQHYYIQPTRLTRHTSLLEKSWEKVHPHCSQIQFFIFERQRNILCFIWMMFLF